MKAYTDIEQSKKLAEILPLESADHFHIIGHIHTDGPKYEVIRARNEVVETDKYWPCWSLAALLNYLRELELFPNIETDEISVTMNINYYNEEEARPLAPVHNIKVEEESFIDACYEMILKLHEQKLL